MPTYNFTFKVTCGSRTPTEVTLYPTSINSKVMSFTGGNALTDEDMANQLKEKIEKLLKEL